MKLKKTNLLNEYIANMAEAKKKYLLQGMEYRKKILLLKKKVKEDKREKPSLDPHP
jgi:hypothetical protein